jgi:hypothetical protein
MSLQKGSDNGYSIPIVMVDPHLLDSVSVINKRMGIWNFSLRKISPEWQVGGNGVGKDTNMEILARMFSTTLPTRGFPNVIRPPAIAFVTSHGH